MGPSEDSSTPSVQMKAKAFSVALMSPWKRVHPPSVRESEGLTASMRTSAD